MTDKKEFSNIEAANFLGITRQRLWIIRDYYNLHPVKKFGHTSVYKLKDLERVKREREEKRVHDAELAQMRREKRIARRRRIQ